MTSEAETGMQQPDAPLGGHVDARFVGLREEFARRLASGEDLGASFSLILHGEPVVDLWGGWTDPDRTTPWSRDTLTNVWSISKTVSTLAVLVLLDRGLIDLDEPVGTYWPEFAVAGKAATTVRNIMQHSSGVSGWDQPITPEEILDVPAAAARLAAQKPWWPAGTASGYHLFNFGHLVGELVRRIDGRSLGRFVAEELAEPLGADFWLGLPESEDHRVSNVVPPTPRDDLVSPPPSSPAYRTYTGPPLDARISWTPEWRAAGIGAAGGQGNARSVARLNALISGGGEVDGVRLFSEQTVSRIFESHTDGVDLVLGMPLRFALGYAVSNPVSSPHIPEGRVAFWGGWGGSVVVNDLDRGFTFAYVMNRMESGALGSPRTRAYVRAVYEGLGT